MTRENYNEQMEFPDTWEEFEEYYGFYDTEEVYTNKSRLIQSFRVKQWLEHHKEEPCGDCISREAVLKAIDAKAWEFCDYLIREGRNDEQKPVSHFADNLRECVGEDLPPITPQPKIGKWEKHDVRGQRVDCCSVCGLSNGTIYEYNYCPNCGAKMENEI